MDIWSWLQEVAILIVVYEITAVESDLLESFRPKEDNPPELNEFLTSVLEHKDDFNFVKQVARKYQKMKKAISDMDFLDDLHNSQFYDSFPNTYKVDDKRHVYHYNPSRRFRNPGFLLPNMQRNKYHKIKRRVKKHIPEFEENDIKKRVPEIIMLQEEDDTIRKRMPSPLVMQPAKKKSIEKHIPSQIFVEDQGEPVKKRTPEEIVVEPEGEIGRLPVDEGVTRSQKEKKQAIDLSSEVHRTYKFNPRKGMNKMNRNQQNDFYYVDLEDAAKREKDRYNDRRRYGWSPHNQGFYSRPDQNRMYRPLMRGRPGEGIDYPQYEIGPHHSLSDEVAFEKALSYEIEPRYLEGHENYNNNPSGNNLYSVDAGRPENVEPLYPPQMYQGRMQGVERYEYPPQGPEAITNERFYINNGNNMQKAETTSTESTTASNTSAKVTDEKNNAKSLKHVGNGFIEITKSRRDSENENFSKSNDAFQEKTRLVSPRIEDKEIENHKFSEEPNKHRDQSSILSKHSLHPLRVKDTSHDENDEMFMENQDLIEDEDESRYVEKRDVRNNEKEEIGFQGRKLLFNDDYMTDFYDQNDYDEIPKRPRRDFLDALGMKNEEDYSEDNPYKNEMNVNNTDVHNDTHIKNTTSRPCSTTVKKTKFGHQKENIKNIKQILEEPKEGKVATTLGPFKKNKEERRAKKNVEFEDFDDLDEIRTVREANKDVATKILQNKNKIYNAHEDNQNPKLNNNHVQIRQERTMPKWSEEIQKQDNLNLKNPLPHKINKKEDTDCTETTPIPIPANCTEPSPSTENINSNYEQVAHQMDIENEKLAQVVNGHLASKIVSTVFEELKKKSALKTKFYSGLSRKHVNYAGTIDFDIFKTNETEDVDEARLLLDQITKVLNRLVLNQVRRKLCQRLPDELKDYLDILLNVKNTLEATNFVPNTKQGDFLFTYQENNAEPPFDLKKLQDVLVQLEGLLLNYHNMNEDCQNRAGPVKDYIEKHVKMLKQIVNCPTNNCEDKLTETKRDTPAFHNVLVQKQLDSLGLGRNHEFVPNFDVNQLVKNKMKANGWKTDKKRDIQTKNNYKSPQYRKLQLAAERIREKRENEKKIAELFGGKKKRSLNELDVEYEEPVVYSLG